MLKILLFNLEVKVETSGHWSSGLGPGGFSLQHDGWYCNLLSQGFCVVSVTNTLLLKNNHVLVSILSKWKLLLFKKPEESLFMSAHLQLSPWAVSSLSPEAETLQTDASTAVTSVYFSINQPCQLFSPCRLSLWIQLSWAGRGVDRPAEIKETLQPVRQALSLHRHTPCVGWVWPTLRGHWSGGSATS